MPPRSGALRRLGSRDELRDAPQLVPFFNDFIAIDDLRPLAKLVTPIDIQMWPGNRRYLFEQISPLDVTGSFPVTDF